MAAPMTSRGDRGGIDAGIGRREPPPQPMGRAGTAAPHERSSRCLQDGLQDFRGSGGSRRGDDARGSGATAGSAAGSSARVPASSGSDRDRRTGASAREPPRTVSVYGIEGMKLRRSDLVSAFNIVGIVENCELLRDHALITFSTSRAAERAVSQFDGGELGDRAIEVAFREEPDDRLQRREMPPPARAPHGADRARDAARSGGASRTLTKMPEVRSSGETTSRNHMSRRSRSPRGSGSGLGTQRR